MDSFGKKYSIKLKLALLLSLLFLYPVQRGLSQPAEAKYKRHFFVYNKDQRNYIKKFLEDHLLQDYIVGRSFALIAGVSYYPKMGITACGGQGNKLDPAKIDINKMKYYLKEIEGFDEIVVLENENVNLDNFAYFLQTYFAENIKKYPKSRFLFAYSGHGITEDGNGYLLKSDALNCSDKSHSIKLDVLYDLVQEVINESHHSLVLINSCYGGKFLRFGEGNDLIPRHPGAHAITAGSDGEITFAEHDRTGSLFFEKIFTGLDGRANENSAIITATNLYAYVHERIRGETDQKQNPKLGDIYPDGSRGEFFFINRNELKDIPYTWSNPSVDWINFGGESKIDDTDEIDTQQDKELTADTEEASIDPASFLKGKKINVTHTDDNIMQANQVEIKLESLGMIVERKKVYQIDEAFSDILLYPQGQDDTASLIQNVLRDIVELEIKIVRSTLDEDFKIIIGGDGK